MQDLTKLTDQELGDFFNSFDTILADIDGNLPLFHSFHWILYLFQEYYETSFSQYQGL